MGKGLDEVFSNKKLKLPLTIEDNSLIFELLKNTFEEYAYELRAINDDKLLNDVEIDQILKSCYWIIESIKSYYEGNTAEAINIFEINCKSTISKLPIKTYSKDFNFYRIRVNNDNFTLKRKELFHIPFQFRNKVNTQRFSIPGFPCLYAGTSSYICWEELNRPDFDKVQIARIQNIKELNLTNLSFAQYHNVSDKTLNIKDLIYSYPIIAACSLKVPLNRKDDPFKPEYIFPQILFQVLFKIDRLPTTGIVYSTTKIYGKDKKNIGNFENIVIPTSKNVKPDGYCEDLTNAFRMTNVIAGWPISLISGINKFPKNKLQIQEIELDGLLLKYERTNFALLENLLSSLTSTPIKPNFEGE